MGRFEVLHGDALETLRGMPEASVHCVVTSPPYWGLRDYGVAGQLGLESTPGEYVMRMVDVMEEVRRVLHPAGTLWLNMRDCYAAAGVGGAQGETGQRADRKHTQRTIIKRVSTPGVEGGGKTQGKALRADEAGRTLVGGLKPKDKVGMPWRLALAMQQAGWYVRQDIVWHKPNPMPESTKDRPTTAHEYVFLMSKSERYYYDFDLVAEPARRTEVAPPPFGWASGAGARTATEWSKKRKKGDGREERPSVAAGDVTTRNLRSVWTLAPGRSTSDSHFATFPEELAERCILAGCPLDGVVLDPFSGTGTTGAVALRLGRRYVGIELNAGDVASSRRRLETVEAQGDLFRPGTADEGAEPGVDVMEALDLVSLCGDEESEAV